MIMRHDTILNESGKNTLRNNSNYKYGWIYFQVVSSSDIQVTKMFSDKLKWKEVDKANR